MSNHQKNGKKTNQKAGTSKVKNPLYVVTQKGKVVEEAGNLMDALLKKLGVEKTIQDVLAVLTSITQSILEQITTYAALLAFKDYFDEILAKVEIFLEKVLGIATEKTAKA